MLRFNRASEPPPLALIDERAVRARAEMRSYFSLDERERAQTRVPRPDFDMDDPTIVAALTRLFKGKCAFCEARREIAPYLFRPASDATPGIASGFSSLERFDHLYYAWLGLAWENIFPICKDCRPYEGNYFPVQNRRCPLPTDEQLDRYVEEKTGLWRDYPIPEKAQLLDPTDGRIRFAAHLESTLDGWLRELSAQGRDTLEYFNLNSNGIVERRASAYSGYLNSVFGRGRVDPRDPVYKAAFDFEALEYGGSWYLILRKIASAVLANQGGRRLPGPREMPRYFAGLRRRGSGLFDLGRVIDLLEGVPNESPKPRIPIREVRPPRTRGLRQLVGVQIHNYKGIEELDITLPPAMEASPTRKWVAEAPSLLILGENAAGKTSVLEAVALALCERPERDLAGPRSALILDPAQLGGSSERPSDARILLEFDQGRAGLIITEREFEEDRDYLDCHAQMPRVFAYGAFRQYTATSGSGGAHRRYSENLFRSELLLPNPETWLLDLPEAIFEEVARALRIIIAGEATFAFIERDHDAQRCYLVSPIERSGHAPSSARTPLSAVSSGFRSILAMACDIFRGLLQERGEQSFERLEKAQAVVLIDEVEAHLHPRWKLRIMAGFREALPNVTFIATTHDPLCLRSMEDVEVCVLQNAPTNVGRYPSRVEKLERAPSASTMTVEQLLTSDLFQLVSTDNADLDLALAKMADERTAGMMPVLSAYDRQIIEEHERDVESALPIGSSMAHRMVQEAVADFLRARSTLSFEQRRNLREVTKKRILEALGENFDAIR